MGRNNSTAPGAVHYQLGAQFLRLTDIFNEKGFEQTPQKYYVVPFGTENFRGDAPGPAIYNS